MSNKKRPRRLAVVIGGAVLAMGVGTAVASVTGAQATEKKDPAGAVVIRAGVTRDVIGFGRDLDSARNDVGKNSLKLCNSLGFATFGGKNEKIYSPDSQDPSDSYEVVWTVTCSRHNR